MSNKIQLQINNTKYVSLIETLRGKAAGNSGEDVTDETNTYTTKLAELETAIGALETELEGKASGGSGGGNVETYDLVVQSDGVVHLSMIRYISYTNGEYQYHIDNVSETNYPITFTDVVLRTPIDYSYRGGAAPYLALLSDIDYVGARDFTTDLTEDITIGILPLSTDNGQVILRLYDDD